MQLCINASSVVTANALFTAGIHEDLVDKSLGHDCAVRTELDALFSPSVCDRNATRIDADINEVTVIAKCENGSSIRHQQETEEGIEVTLELEVGDLNC